MLAGLALPGRLRLPGDSLHDGGRLTQVAPHRSNVSPTRQRTSPRWCSRRTGSWSARGRASSSSSPSSTVAIFHGCGEFHPFTVVSSEPGSGRFTLLVRRWATAPHARPRSGHPRARRRPPRQLLATIDPARPSSGSPAGSASPLRLCRRSPPPAAERRSVLPRFQPAGSGRAGEAAKLAGSGRHLKLPASPARDDFAHIWQKIREQLPDLRGPPGSSCAGRRRPVDGLRLALTEAGVAQSGDPQRAFRLPMKKLVTLATIAFWAIFALALARAPEPAATTSPAPGTAPSDAVRPKSLRQPKSRAMIAPRIAG